MIMVTTIFHQKLKGDFKDRKWHLIKEVSIWTFFKFRKSLRSRGTKGQLIIAIKSLYRLLGDSFMLLFRQNKNRNFNRSIANIRAAGPSFSSLWPI